MTLHFRSAGRTDVGKVRRRNEDAILVRDDVGLWLVADGLGGHAAGDYASGMIVDRLAALPRDEDVLDFIESIEDTMVDVNADLRRTARQRGSDIIGSTLVLLVHHKDFMLCGWVGDSRVYVRADGQFSQITRDHVHGVKDDVTQFGSGATSPSQSGGALTRAVGAEDSVFLDWAVAGNRPGMQFVLCSDGLTKEMTDSEIDAVCARHEAPDAAVDELFAISLDRAARDNVSAVVVQLSD